MNGSEHEPRPDGPDRIEQLLRNAVARERPSAAEEQVIREALRTEWQAATRRRRRRRAGWAAAGLAAALVLAVTVLQRPATAPEPTVLGERLAGVEAVSGQARVAPGVDAGPSLAQPGADLYAGQEIATAAARLALRWREGSSVRIDEHTTIRLAGDGAAELVRGRVYVDAGTPSAAAGGPVILTPAGPVRHIGTQYMVSVEGVSFEDATTRISVRDGQVTVTAGGRQRTASGGQQLSVVPGGEPDLRPIPVYGEEWFWADALAAPFAADGRSIAEFLDWVGRETGHRVEFESAAAEERARTSRLHGAITLEPMRALEPVLQTANLVASVHNGIIRVRLRTDN